MVIFRGRAIKRDVMNTSLASRSGQIDESIISTSSLTNGIQSRCVTRDAAVNYHFPDRLEDDLRDLRDDGVAEGSNSVQSIG